MLLSNLFKKYPSIFLFTILAIIPIFVRNDFYLSVFTTVLLWAAMSASWNIMAGYGGLLSLGHSIFFGLGAYTSSLLFMHYKITPWIGMIVGGVFAAIIGVLISYPCFRLRGPFFALATVALAEVTRIIAIHSRNLTGGSNGLSIRGTPSLGNFIFHNREPYYYIILILVLIIYLITELMQRTRFGYYLVAIREDEDAASSVGINIVTVKVKAVAISAFLAAMCGTFFAQFFLFIDPENTLHMGVSLQFTLFSIIGGIGTPLGPILGAFLVGPTNEFMRGLFGATYSAIRLIIYGGVLVIMVILLPEGIIPWLTNLAERRFKIYKLQNR